MAPSVFAEAAACDTFFARVHVIITHLLQLGHVIPLRIVYLICPSKRTRIPRVIVQYLATIPWRGLHRKYDLIIALLGSQKSVPT